MPIYMDRHDMLHATAENVADAHRRDLAIQERYGVRYITYWHDPQRGTAFCLVEAPDAATAERVHREAHGEIATDIIEVELGAVEAFLGCIAGPPAGAEPPVESALRAVVFTDIVGSTEMTARLGDTAALALVRVHDSLVRRSILEHGGREVKHTGDGIMAAFKRAEDAVRGAADMQRRLARYNAGTAAQRLAVRIGIHVGEPVADHDDLFGMTVQLAARLCGEAGPAEVLVSDLVRSLCRDDAARFVPEGERRLKGVAEAVTVFRVDWLQMSAGAGLDGPRGAAPGLRSAPPLG